MNKKNTTIYLYILIAVFTLFIGTATYAFFAGSGNINATANLSVAAGGSYTFTSTSATDFNLDINSADMSQSKSGNYISSSLGSIDVDLTSPDGMITACTFDLLLTWTSSQRYTESDVSLPYTHTDGTTYNYEFSTLVKDGENIEFPERDISKVNRNTGFGGSSSGTIAEDLFIEADSTSVSKTYLIEARIYNLPVNQPNLINKNMNAKITITNLDCQYEIEEDIDVSTLNYLSTNSGNTIFNLVNKQGVDVTNVDSVYFVDTRKTKPGSAENIALFKGTDGNAIKAWTNGNNLYIGSKGTTYPGPSMDNAFYNMQNLNVLDINNVNTSNVTNMSTMFDNTGRNSTVFTLNLGNKFNTSKVTDMAWMFSNTGYSSTVFTLNLGNEFNTSNVTNMFYIFQSTGYSSPVFTLNLGNEFNTSNVTSMYSMFDGTGHSSTVFTLNLGNEFNTSNVTNMYSMFSGTGHSSTIFTLNLGNQFNTSNVTNMQSMFSWTGRNCTVFTLNLGNEFNTSNVTNMSNMFLQTGFSSPNFTLNLGNQFNTSKVTNMSNMFSNTGKSSTVFTLNLGNEFNTSKVTNMVNMFTNTGYSSSWTLNLKSFDFSKVGRNYSNFFRTRSSSNILTVLCSPTNGDFINARVSGLAGYNVVCS